MQFFLKKDILYHELRNRIFLGIYRAGTRLSGGIELAKEFCVAHRTMRLVLEQLEVDGYITTKKGVGSFVNPTRSNTARVLVIKHTDSQEDAISYILPNFLKDSARLNAETEVLNADFLKQTSPHKVLKLLRSKNYTGMFVSGHGWVGNEAELLIMKELGIPGIILAGTSSDVTVSGFTVLLNNYQEAWLTGLRFLRKMGHTRIAVLSAKHGSLRAWSLEQTMTFLQENNADPDPELYGATGYVAEGGADEIHRLVRFWMKLPQPPTAIYCFSDFFAIPVYDQLKKMKIRIPETVSVLGYCGYPGGEILFPGLTTVDVGYIEMGRRAAQLLCSPNCLNMKIPPAEIIIPHRILKRKSVVQCP